MNKGMKAHHHGMNAMSLLFHHHWNGELLAQIKHELQQSVALMEEHVRQFKCRCGDSEAEVQFYQNLASHIEQCIVNQDWLAVPWVQEQLHRYYETKRVQHHCMRYLLNTTHNWAQQEKCPL